MRVLWKRTKWANVLINNEDQLRNVIARLEVIKSSLLALKTEVEADPDATAEDLTTVGQIGNFVNHQKWVDFVNFINNALN
ncbi:MAG: hypothetical protein ONB55_21700 [candidate division KSB1 bacterium]|nr:hypothetical protein [candidate division KSB1 bacterium]